MRGRKKGGWKIGRNMGGRVVPGVDVLQAAGQGLSLVGQPCLGWVRR